MQHLNLVEPSYSTPILDIPTYEPAVNTAAQPYGVKKYLTKALYLHRGFHFPGYEFCGIPADPHYLQRFLTEHSETLESLTGLIASPDIYKWLKHHPSGIGSYLDNIGRAGEERFTEYPLIGLFFHGWLVENDGLPTLCPVQYYESRTYYPRHWDGSMPSKPIGGFVRHKVDSR